MEEVTDDWMEEEEPEEPELPLPLPLRKDAKPHGTNAKNRAAIARLQEVG